jgi:hypothetical protein
MSLRLLPVAAPVIPEAYQARALLHACEDKYPNSERNTPDRGNCIGTISGWGELIAISTVSLSDGTVCKIDPNVSNETLVDVFVAYAKAHPQYGDKLGFQVFWWAVVDAGLNR